MAGEGRRMKVPPLLNPLLSTQPDWQGHPLFTLERIYHAYRQCRHRKRGTSNALFFEQNLEENLLALHQELNSGSYKPGRSIAFLVDKPKKREIFAADFRDRVVHHLLVGHLEPAWERRFIHDSYACRKGKGTHQGVARLRSFLRKATNNKTQTAWYLQLDVRGFFVAIDKSVLYQQLAAKENDPTVLWLIRQMLLTDPTDNCLLRGDRLASFMSLPAHKTLFKASKQCGLPIGNLTSQFFANVYLDALDQFVKHQLKAKWYLRYCDDFILVSQNRGQLLDWEQKIGAFLQKNLKLELNERRRLRPTQDGVDFLGYIIRPDYLLVRRRVVGSLMEKLRFVEHSLLQAGMKLEGRYHVYPWPHSLLQKLNQWLTAYMAHFKKANSYRLVANIKQQFGWLDEYYYWQEWQPQLRYMPPRYARNFADQVSWFKKQLPDNLLFIQLGAFWKPVSQDEIGLMKLPAHIHNSRLNRYQSEIVQIGRSIGWISETGRRIEAIAERALTVRWQICSL